MRSNNTKYVDRRPCRELAHWDVGSVAGHSGASRVERGAAWGLRGRCVGAACRSHGGPEVGVPVAGQQPRRELGSLHFTVR